MADFVHEDEDNDQLQAILAKGETFLLGVLLWAFILYLILRYTVLKPKEMSKNKKGNMKQRRRNFGCWMKLLVSFIIVMFMCYFLILLKIGIPAETRLVLEEMKPQEASTGRDAVRSSSHRMIEEADSLNVSVTATQSNQHYNEETTSDIATVTINGPRDSNSPPTGLLVNPSLSEQEPHPPTALSATGESSLEQEVVSNPKCPECASFDRRLSSFNGWPKPQQQTPTELAEAGFFYTGVNNCTLCFFCGGGLKNWEQGEIYEKELPSWFKRTDRFTNEEMNLTVYSVRCFNWTLYDFERYMRIPHGVIPVSDLPIPALSPIGDQPAPEVQHQLEAYHPLAAEAATNYVEQNVQSEHEGTGNDVVEAPTGKDAVRSSSHRMNEEADSLNVSVTTTQSNQHNDEETIPDLATVTNLVSQVTNVPQTGLLVNPSLSEQEPHPPTALSATGESSLEQEVVSNPKYPECASFDRRLRSFNGWPKPQQQTPTELAEAGFFYTGVNNCTRCFFCGGGLKNWEQGEEPILEHMIQFQDCPYVKELEKAGHVQAARIRKEKREQNALAQINGSSSADQIQGTGRMNMIQRAHPASSDDQVQGASYIGLEQIDAIADDEPNWQARENDDQQFEADHTQFGDIQNQPGSIQFNISHGMNETGRDNGTNRPIQASQNNYQSAPEHILERLGYSRMAIANAVETVTSNGILVYTATDLGKILVDES